MKFPLYTWCASAAVTVVCACVPMAAYAATPAQAILSFTLSSSDPESYMVEVWLVAGTMPINAIEGSLKIPSSVQMQQINTSNAGITQWVQQPTYNPSAHVIQFGGGDVDTIAPQQKARIFTVYASSTHMDPASFLLSATAYDADGKGTSEKVTVTTTTNPANPVSTTVSSDHTPPTNLVVDIGRDPSLFNGQYFISMSAVDPDSGIDHYEVKEGFGGSFHRVDSLYVLQGDPSSTYIEVHAVDKAGNVAVYRLFPEDLKRSLLVLLGVAVVGVVGIRIFIVRV